MYAILIFVVIFLLYCNLALSKKFLYWKKRGVPHPTFSIIFGNLSESIFLKKNLGQVFDEIYRAYPNLSYVGIYKIRQPALLIRDPELLKEMLIKDFNYFNENDAEVDKENDYLISKNPFFLKGNDWKIGRGQLAPSLTNNKMKSIFPLMETVSQNFVKHLEDPVVANGGTDVKSLCEKYTMDVAALSVLGLEANSFKLVNTDYISNIKKIVSPGILMSIKFTSLRLLPILTKFCKIKFIPDDAANYFKNVIRNALNFREKNNIKRNDFLQSMQELKQKLGSNEFSDDDITAHSLSFFLDGFETSSIVLSYALYELGAKIEYQEKLREEIETALRNGNGQFSFDSVHEMEYLNNFLCESMRLHPPALFLSRRCTKEYRIPATYNNQQELLVEHGTPIIIPIYSLHYDPKYFVNPHEFDPNRFSNDNIIHKCTFLPFGDGPRMCIGQKYAIAQIKVAIAHLVVNYDIRVNTKTITPLQIDSNHFLLSPKGGIWLNFIKRKKYQ